MILGRTASNAIKIKTDGGLRAVECACCCIPFNVPYYSDLPISTFVGETLAKMPQMSVNFSVSGKDSSGNPVSMSFSGVIPSQSWQQDYDGSCYYEFDGGSGGFPNQQVYNLYVLKTISNQWYINFDVTFAIYPYGVIGSPDFVSEDVSVAVNVLGDIINYNAQGFAGNKISSASLSFYV